MKSTIFVDSKDIKRIERPSAKIKEIAKTILSFRRNLYKKFMFLVENAQVNLKTFIMYKDVRLNLVQRQINRKNCSRSPVTEYVAYEQLYARNTIGQMRKFTADAIINASVQYVDRSCIGNQNFLMNQQRISKAKEITAITQHALKMAPKYEKDQKYD